MDQLNYTNTFEINDELEEVLSERENNKKSIITFSRLNKYFLIPFLYPVFCVLRNIFKDLVVESKVINNSKLFYSISIDLSYIFAGLFYFKPYFKTNFNKKNNSGSIYIYNKVKIDKCKSCKIIMFIILLSLINIFQDFISIFIDYNKVFEKSICDLFFIPLFSKIILKENIYKHNYFALIISIIGVIFLLIPFCLQISTNDIISNILNFIIGIFYSLFVVIVKYMIEKYYMHPLKICLLVGIIILFFECIIFLIYSLIKYNNLSYFNDCFDFSKVQNKFAIIIYIILYILFCISLKLLGFLLLFYFSPTLIIITSMISPFIYWIVQSIKNKVEILDAVLYPIGYLILIFSSLIYNEIIILNFCGLNNNTKKFVNQRLNKEVEKINKDKDDLLSEKEN